MMLKPSIDTLLDKVPSEYSLCILQAKHAHGLEVGAKPIQEFKSVETILQTLEETGSSNVVVHPDLETKRATVLIRIEAERLAKGEGERKIKEQIVKEKEEGEKI